MQRGPAQLASDLANGAFDQTAAGLALPVARMLDHMHGHRVPRPRGRAIWRWPHSPL